jgi:hypothetical protein
MDKIAGSEKHDTAKALDIGKNDQVILTVYAELI